MKKTVLLFIFTLFIFTKGENAIRKTDYSIKRYDVNLQLDTIIPEESSQTKDFYDNTDETRRSKTNQSKDYAYGKNNLFSFIFAVLSVFCLVLLFATIPLQIGVLSVIFYLLHSTFIVFSFLRGLKGIKEKKMKILGILGLISSSCFGLLLLIGLGSLAIVLLLLLIGGL